MRLKKLFIIVILAILFCTTYVCAVEPQIMLEGEQIAKPNETKTLTIKIASETEIGVVSGKIEANENIVNMNITGKNNWNLTFNKDTGVFNIYKAEGSKSEEIINIEYTTANTEGMGTITISNLKMTTIEYETKDVANVVKEITIKSNEEPTPNPDPDPNPNPNPDPDPEDIDLINIKITKIPAKTTYKEGEKFDKTGMVVTAEYSDGTNKEITNYTFAPSEALKVTDKKITISYTEGNITKTVQQDIIVTSNLKDDNTTEKNENEDNTKNEGKLPQTGVKYDIIFMVMIVIIIGTVSYFGYKKYKNI